jgi:thymidylate kinase
VSEQSEIGQLVTAVFRAWHAAEINFLVLRNYENLPHSTTNDIDVLVSPAQLRPAEQILLAAARDTGFRLHNRAEFATLALYFSRPDPTAQVHFDLFTALKWRGFDFLDCPDFLERKIQRGSFAVPLPAHEAATNLLASMIFTGKVKEKYKPSIAAGFRAEPKAAADLLAGTCGPVHANFLVQAGAQEQWKEIEARTGALRRSLIFRQLTRRPLRTLASLLTDAVRLTRRFLRPPGLTVVLCGADGSGKSTAADAVIATLSPTFSPLKGRHFHWKPPVFSAKRQAQRPPATDPHNEPVRNPLLSLVYFSFHSLEFFLGSHLRIRPVTFKGGLVLIDRFYYDFFVDQRRYRLRVPQSIIKLGYRLLQKPDLVVLLDAPAQVLQSRKQEVPLAETERQCQAYRELIKGLKQGRVVDAAQSPEKVAAELTTVILDFMAQRARTRCDAPDPQAKPPPP